MNVLPQPGVPPIAEDPIIVGALRDGARIVFNLSGGKDSGAATMATTHWLDRLGHPRERRVAIHADLGCIEWQSTGTIVAQIAAAAGVTLIIVRRRAGGLTSRQHHFAPSASSSPAARRRQRGGGTTG